MQLLYFKYETFYFIFFFSRQFDKRNDNQSNNTFIQLIVSNYSRIYPYIFFKKTCFSESIFNLLIYMSNINFYPFTKNTVESIFLIIGLFSNWTRTFTTKFYLRIELSTVVFNSIIFIRGHCEKPRLTRYHLPNKLLHPNIFG